MSLFESGAQSLKAIMFCNDTRSDHGHGMNLIADQDRKEVKHKQLGKGAHSAHRAVLVLMPRAPPKRQSQARGDET